MTRPYPNDLRERVVSAMQAGESRRRAAERFGVAPSSIVKWRLRAARTGLVRLAQMGGCRRPVLELHRVWLLDRVRNFPAVLQEMLAERGGEVSHDTVWRFLRGCGVSRKTLIADERERADVKRRRERWRRHRGRIDPRRSVFIDETRVKISMAPLRGQAPKGNACREYPIFCV